MGGWYHDIFSSRKWRLTCLVPYCCCTDHYLTQRTCFSPCLPSPGVMEWFFFNLSTSMAISFLISSATFFPSMTIALLATLTACWRLGLDRTPEDRARGRFTSISMICDARFSRFSKIQYDVYVDELLLQVEFETAVTCKHGATRNADVDLRFPGECQDPDQCRSTTPLPFGHCSSCC